MGSLDKKKKTVGTGLVGAPACGDVMKLQVHLINNSNVPVNGLYFRSKLMKMEKLLTPNLKLLDAGLQSLRAHWPQNGSKGEV